MWWGAHVDLALVLLRIRARPGIPGAPNPPGRSNHLQNKAGIDVVDPVVDLALVLLRIQARTGISGAPNPPGRTNHK
jgi:hypothetical protein